MTDWRPMVRGRSIGGRVSAPWMNEWWLIGEWVVDGWVGEWLIDGSVTGGRVGASWMDEVIGGWTGERSMVSDQWMDEL
uniref:Bm8196 n=2 Tax=Brugia TaxID=6278 RepID=A0A0J9XM41_BRUMA|nr:Bm8196 [Brugia malayi]